MSSNQTCFDEKAPVGPPLFQDGHIVIQAYHIGWLISGFFALVATVVSLWLINKHLQWYTDKREQRYIVRILFMVPIYALVSFASFLFWNHSTALILIRDGYESTVLTAFFYLLLMYLSHDPEEQKAVFVKVGLSREADRETRRKGVEIKRWVFPLRFVKWKPQDGLHFLQLMKWGVLQYCVVRPTTTLVAVILNYIGLYCEASWGLGWGHIYITIIVSISVTIAMYSLIQLYIPISANLAPRRPLLQLFAVKAIVFLTFWQATFLSFLSMLGVVKDTKYMTAADINIGIGAILETVEMTLFAFLHIRAFSYKPYQSHLTQSMDPPERTPRLRSLGHALDFRETLREIWFGSIYIWDKMRGREPTPDVGARRTAHYKGAFGRTRNFRHREHSNDPDGTAAEDQVATLPNVEVGVEEHVDVEIDGEKQWLGVGDDYGYGLRYARRERSDSLGVQIERELQQRGLTRGLSTSFRVTGSSLIHVSPPESSDLKQGKDKRQPSWWRRFYTRFSEYGSEDEQGERLSVHKAKRRTQGSLGNTVISDYEPDTVSPSQQHQLLRQADSIDGDVLHPLPIFNNPAKPRKVGLKQLSSSNPTAANAPFHPAVSSDGSSLFERISPYDRSESQKMVDNVASNGLTPVARGSGDGRVQSSKVAAQRMPGQSHEPSATTSEAHAVRAGTRKRYENPFEPSVDASQRHRDAYLERTQAPPHHRRESAFHSATSVVVAGKPNRAMHSLPLSSEASSRPQALPNLTPTLSGTQTNDWAP